MKNKISKAFVIFDTWLANSKPQYHNADDFKKHYENYTKSPAMEQLDLEYNIFKDEFLPNIEINES